MRRLSDAARLIVAADLLTPLIISTPGLSQPIVTDYFTVSLQRLYALTPARMAAFASSRCLALDLVTACVFSRRLLVRHVTPQTIEAEPPPPRDSIDGFDLLASLDIGLKLDSSPLFSFEDFARSEPAKVEDKIHADA